MNGLHVFIFLYHIQTVSIPFSEIVGKDGNKIVYHNDEVQVRMNGMNRYPIIVSYCVKYEAVYIQRFIIVTTLL